MVVGLIVGGYVLLAILLSRPVYGFIRARSIEGCVERWAALYRDDPVGQWNRSDRPLVAFMSILAAFTWPVLLAGFLVGYPIFRYVTGSKIRSDVEKEQDKKRIKELEKELGL